MHANRERRPVVTYGVRLRKDPDADDVDASTMMNAEFARHENERRTREVVRACAVGNDASMRGPP